MEKLWPQDKISEARTDALEKIDLHELDLSTEEGLAYWVNCCCRRPIKTATEQPRKRKKCSGRIELALRNVVVLADRIRRNKASLS